MVLQMTSSTTRTAMLPALIQKPPSASPNHPFHQQHTHTPLRRQGLHIRSDLGEPERPLILQRNRRNLPILHIDRIVLLKIEPVPSSQRPRPQRERHLERVARPGDSARIEQVADVHGSAVQIPGADEEALEGHRCHEVRQHGIHTMTRDGMRRG